MKTSSTASESIEVKRRWNGTVDERLPWSGCRLCSLPAKSARRNRDSAVPDLLCDVSKQQLAVFTGEGHSIAPVRWSEHPSPLSGSLN